MEQGSHWLAGELQMKAPKKGDRSATAFATWSILTKYATTPNPPGPIVYRPEHPDQRHPNTPPPVALPTHPDTCRPFPTRSRPPPETVCNSSRFLLVIQKRSRPKGNGHWLTPGSRRDFAATVGKAIDKINHSQNLHMRIHCAVFQEPHEDGSTHLHAALFSEEVRVARNKMGTVEQG